MVTKEQKSPTSKSWIFFFLFLLGSDQEDAKWLPATLKYPKVCFPLPFLYFFNVCLLLDFFNSIPPIPSNLLILTPWLSKFWARSGRTASFIVCPFPNTGLLELAVFVRPSQRASVGSHNTQLLSSMRKLHAYTIGLVLPYILFL